MDQHDPSNPEPDSFEFPGYHGPQIRQTIIAWFQANGVDASRLPADPQATVTDGELTFLSKVSRPGDKGDVIAPDGLGPLTETLTVPVTVPPPPLVEKWLAPRCPTCGR